MIAYYVFPAISERFKKNSLMTDAIIDSICEVYGMSKPYLFAKGRKVGLVMPRHLCCYMLKKHTTMTLLQIGDLFQGESGNPKHHSTVIHSIQTVKDLIETDHPIKLALEQAMDLMYAKLNPVKEVV